MATYGCCMSQDPPSPDALPSRPAASCSTGSGFSKSGDAAGLLGIFGNETSHVEEDQNILTQKKSSSTINAVTSRLRKHLSRELSRSRYHRQSTVGSSEEDVERRRELKLIREKRIKEELSYEDSYDDDAKSFSSIAAKDSPSLARRLGTCTPSPYLVARQTEARMLDLRRQSDIPLQRRHSSAALETSFPLPEFMPDWTLQISPAVSVPPAPVLEPQRLPSIVDSATRRTSWQLSFTSEQRGSRLRALSQDHGATVAGTNSKAEVIRLSPLRWFRSQAIYRPSLGVTRVSGPYDQVDCAPSTPTPHVNLEDSGGVDGNSETNAASIPLHEMRISQRLASSRLHSHSSSPQLSSWGSQAHYRGHSYASVISQHQAINRTKYFRQPSGTGIGEPEIPLSWEDSFHDGISSFYPSAENSIYIDPAHSRLNSLSRSGPEKNSIYLDNPYQQEGQDAPESWTSVPASRSNASKNSLKVPLSKDNRRLILENSPFSSETSGLRDQEAEQYLAKIRLPYSTLNPVPSTPVKSKFMEDFGDPRVTYQAGRQEKMHLLKVIPIPRVAKLASRSFDGPSPFELQLPQSRQGWGYEFSNQSRSTMGASTGARSPRSKTPGSSCIDLLDVEEDGAGEIWAEALKRNRDEYVQHLSAEGTPSKDEKGDGLGDFLTARSFSWRSRGKERPYSEQIVRDLSEGLSAKDKNFELETKLRRQSWQEKMRRKDADDWADELQARERQAKAKTEALGQESPPRSLMRPDFWARFPSHTRSERTSSAGLSDKVVAKDFAIKDVKEGVIEWIRSDRKRHHRHHQKEQHHSLPVRFSNQIRASLYKLQAARSSLKSDAVHGRKSSVSVGGKLEYPELELLPGEIAGSGLVEEVEREAEAEMRRDERIARMVVFGDATCATEPGEIDNDSGRTEHDTSEIPLSIADPRFYEDCVSAPLEYENEDDIIHDCLGAKSISPATPARRSYDPLRLDKSIFKREKFRTWSGRDRACTPCIGSLRKSTVDFQMELQQVEKMERERAVQSAEAAWGQG